MRRSEATLMPDIKGLKFLSLRGEDVLLGQFPLPSKLRNLYLVQFKI